MKHPLSTNLFHLLPNYCTLCGEKIINANKSLCQACQEQLPWLGKGCLYCSLPVTDAQIREAICGHCQQSPPPFQHSYCLFRYGYPIDQLISQLKFNQQLMIGKLLGQLMAEFVCAQSRLEALPESIIPMPLHKRRLRQRGFNQAYEIAAICAKKLNIPLPHGVCHRIKDTPPQLGLDAKTRRRNLCHAFRIDKTFKFRSVAIVDDVMTTGSSMREISSELLQAGVEHIELWCIARTTIE